MSTLKVNAIRATAASSDAITLATDGTCTAKITNNLSNRNLIINGKFDINQRNADASTALSNGAWPIDRWSSNSNGAYLNGQRVADAPAGFKYSLKLTTSGTHTIGNGDYANMQYKIEGYDTEQLAWGTSSAKTITMSFWIKSSLTGSMGGSIRNTSGGYWAYPFTYTISSANTWEHKTITIPGATASNGTWSEAGTNGIGLWVFWDFGTGTDYTTTAGSWSSGNNVGADGTVKLATTNAATWQITGWQLEVGDYASDYCHEPYSETLSKCQRYYFRDLDTDGTTDLSPGVYACTYQNNHKIAMIWLPVPMRATPTMTAVWVNGTYNVAKSSNTRMEGYFSSNNDSNSPIHSTSIKCEAEL